MARYPLGQPVRLSTTVRDTASQLVNAGALTLTVRKPDTTEQTYSSPVNDSTGVYHQDVPAADLTQLGRYEYAWTSTGAGAGVSPPGGFDVYDPFEPQIPTPTVVSWAPPLAQVAAYVPKRTRPVSDTTDDPLGTFNDSTRPTDVQVLSLIGDACRWVLAKTGVPADNAAATASAGVAAALRAAAFVELGYPGEDPDTNIGDLLLQQADAAVADVIAAADTDPNPGSALVPVYSFPTPVPWGDLNL